MKLASDALKIVTHDDAELTKKPQLRTGEAPPDLEVDPSNLMGLLGEIDGLKQEIHERMRRVEAVKQAKSILLEDAVRTEALNKRLAEIGKVMSSVHPGLLAAEATAEEPEVPELPRMRVRESHPEVELRPGPARIQSEGVTLPWRRPDEAADSVLQIQLAPVEQHSAMAQPEVEDATVAEAVSVAFEAASQRLQEAEQEWKDAWKRSDEAAVEARRLLEEAESRLDAAVQKEEQAVAQFNSVREEVAAAYVAVSQRLEDVELGWKDVSKRSDEATVEAKRLLEESVSSLDAAARKEEQAAAQFDSVREEVRTAYEAASQLLVDAEQGWKEAWKQSDEAAIEAKRLLDQSVSHLSEAVSREEKAATQFHTVREEVTAAYDAASQRLEEAERIWGKTEAAAREARRLYEASASQLEIAAGKEEQASAEFHSAQETLTAAHSAAKEKLEEAERVWHQTELAIREAKQILDQSIAELDQVKKKEESITASIQAVRADFTAAYQCSSQRLEEAEKFWQKGDQAAQGAQNIIDQTTAELLQARSAEEKAAADLYSARQELTTAYQFASVAAQRRLDAAEFFQKSARWSVVGTAFSWVAMVWAVWFALRAQVPIWAPGIATVVVISLAFVFGRMKTRDV